MKEEDWEVVPCPCCGDEPDENCSLCEGKGELQVVVLTGMMLARDILSAASDFAIKLIPYVAVGVAGYLLGGL